MPRTILGKVSLTPKGEYSPDTAYTALDVVSYGGNSWMALKDVTGVAPAEGENWMLLAQKGDQGEQGIQGIQGIQGETGGPGPTGPQGASFTRLEKTAGTGAPGTIDTYTAYNSEGQAAGTVQVYNGMDGTGAGDFKADGTVPMTGNLQMAQHKVTGVADATEVGDAVNKGQMDAALEGVTVTADAAPTEDSTNPVQSGGVYTALAGKADLTLSNLSNYQKALAAIGGKPRDNLLDNWYFVGGGSQQGGGQFPINQRGKTSYGMNVPAFDRWRTTTNCSLLTIEQDGITCNAKISGQYPLKYYLDLDYSVLAGRQVTVSALIDDDLISATNVIPAQKPVASNTKMVLSSSGGSYDVGSGYSANKDLFMFGFFARVASASAKLKAAKLEFGPTQTLAYQDEDGNWQLFETPDYGEELAKCQRYLLPLLSDLVPASVIGTGAIFFFIPTPVEMRVAPSIALNNFAVRSISGNNQTGFTFSVSSVRSNGVFVSATKANHGLDSAMINAGSSPGTLLSAEL